MPNAALPFPVVAMDFMNRDHAAFADLHRRLIDLLETNAADACIDHALDDLLRHTRVHFADEERLMLDVRFPAYAVHRAEHERMLAEMSEQVHAWRRDRDFGALAAWIRSSLAAWFVDHIGTMDLMTARFAATNGGS